MSKVSFRARALDATKPMPVYRADEIPDLPDFATINRSVPQMPTGMEKEEETEHHLQRALSAQQVYGSSEKLVIPIPEIQDIGERYEQLYKDDFKLSKQYIHIQAFGMDQEIPDYDMDSEDETWMKEQVKKMEITPLKFEEMMDRLEKGSGQQVVTIQEAKLLLKEDDDLIIAVYDYWLNKRLRTQQPLIPQVKTEKRDGSTTNNPYVAFRRRTEKMQTRKNRKNDETSYEKMLKLRRDLNRAVTLLEVIKRREKSKKELLQLTIEILDKRYHGEDFSGALLAEAEAERVKHPSFVPPFMFNRQGEWVTGLNGEEIAPVIRKKRQYRKRKQAVQQQPPTTAPAQSVSSSHYEMENLHQDLDTSDEEGFSPSMSQSDHEDENDPDGPFAFKRRKHCSYYAPLTNRLGNWRWESREEGGLGDKKYRYSLMSLPHPRNCVGFARRRVGRGGRVLIDRGFTPWDDELDRMNLSNSGHTSIKTSEYITYIREKKIPHFRPRTPSPEESVTKASEANSSMDTMEFNLESYQSHQEQLLQMKRDQEERLRLDSLEIDSSINLEHSFCSQPTSRFTLDRESAELAVTAVLNCSEITSASNGANSTRSSSSSLVNGPVIDSKPSGLSTSPAANVLQLNFPLHQPASIPSPLTSSLSSSSSASTSSSSSSLTAVKDSNLTTNRVVPVISAAPAVSVATTVPVPPLSQAVVTTTTAIRTTATPVSVMSLPVNDKGNNIIKQAANSAIKKFNSASTPVSLELLHQNHEDPKTVLTLSEDKVVAMDVT